MTKVLKVGVEMGGSRNEASIPLPDDWDQMSAEEQRLWADECLDVHVGNNVNAWWDVEES